MTNVWQPIFTREGSENIEVDERDYIRLELKYIDYDHTVQDATEYDYFITLFMFDAVQSCAKSKLWQSNSLRKQFVEQNQLRLSIQECLYMSSSPLNESTSLMIILSKRSSPDSPVKSEIGWCSVNVKFSRGMEVSKVHECVLNKGSSRVAFVNPYLLSSQPSKLKSTSRILFSISSHDVMENCAQFMPNNTFIAGSDRIVGIPIDRGMLLGRIEPCCKVYLGDINVTVDGLRMDALEKEICDNITENLLVLYRQNTPLDIFHVSIIDRKLKVFGHNRHTMIRPIPVVNLDCALQSGKGNNKRLRRLSSWKSRSSLTENITNEISSEQREPRMALTARNAIELNIPNDPDCAVIFMLEYTFSMTDPRKQPMSRSDPLKLSFNVKWGSYVFPDSPSALSNTQTITKLDIPLHGSSYLDGGLINSPRTNHEYFDLLPPGFSENIKDCEKIIARKLCPDGSFCLSNQFDSGFSIRLRCNLSVGQNIMPIMQEPIPKNEIDMMDSSVKKNIRKSSERKPLDETLDTETQPIVVSTQQSMVQSKRPSSSTKKPIECQPSMSPKQMQAQLNLYAQLLQQAMLMQAKDDPNLVKTLLGPQIGPFLGSQSALNYEPIQPESVAPYVVMNQISGQPVTIASKIHRGMSLSRSAYGKLFAAGFPLISAENGDAPYTINPDEDPDPIKTFELKRELDDVYNCNEIIIQFLAFSNFDAKSKINNRIIACPEQIVLTFQFYRFSQITTERLYLGKDLDDCVNNEGMRCQILYKSEFEPTVKNQMENTKHCETAKTPGYQLIFSIDPNYLKPGEYESFFNYLLYTNLHIDVWDAKSHLLIGTTMVELKHLCRQGRPAVQVSYVLDVIKSPDWDLYEDDTTDDNLQARLVKDDGIQGRIHVRLANVGHRSKVTTTELVLVNQKHKRYLICSEDSGYLGSFRGGALSDATLTRPKISEVNLLPSGPRSTHVVRARPVKLVSSELENLLESNNTLQGVQSNSSTINLNPMKQQKLARLHLALNNLEIAPKFGSFVGLKNFNHTKASGPNQSVQLSTVNNYRQQKKRELIQLLLSGIYTIEHSLYTSFGCSEFFEFELKNSSNMEDTIRIQIEDDCGSLSLVSDPCEVRAFKKTLGITTPTEEALFTVDETDSENQVPGCTTNRNQLGVFLKPREKVLIPFKYMEFTMLNLIQNKQNKLSLPGYGCSTFVEKERTIQVNFKSNRSGKFVSRLILKIIVRPALIDQTFRFFHPELSFLKKVIRLPLSNMDPSGQIWIRSSDPNILTMSNSVSGSTTLDLLVKIGLGNSPQIREFLLAVYMEPFQIRPLYIWHWSVQALSRLDAVAVLGQTTTPIPLLLRCDGLVPMSNTRKVGVFTSHPKEVIIGTELQSNQIERNSDGGINFAVSPRAVYELKVRIRPKLSGKRTYQINVVDLDSRSVIRAWILCVDVKPPDVTKTFNIQVPLTSYQSIAEPCNKRIAFTNPYSVPKRLLLESDRPDLVEFKESALNVDAGATVHIGLRFIPQTIPLTEQMYVFVKDDLGTNLETFSIISHYK